MAQNNMYQYGAPPQQQQNNMQQQQQNNMNMNQYGAPPQQQYGQQNMNQYGAPPPPSTAPPRSKNPWKKNAAAPSQAEQDKNAAFLAKIRAKQAAKKKSEPTSDFDNEPKQKISLFGGTDALNQAKIANHMTKKKDKYVVLPDTGLTETELFQKYKIQSNDKIGAGAFARIKIIKGRIHKTKL